MKILIKIIFLNFRHPKIIGFLSWMLDVDFGFFGCLSLSFEFGLPHPHPKLNFFWVPVSACDSNRKKISKKQILRS